MGVIKYAKQKLHSLVNTGRIFYPVIFAGCPFMIEKVKPVFEIDGEDFHMGFFLARKKGAVFIK